MIIQIWNSEAEIGYKQITTFYADFSIADMFGVKGVKDTFNRAFKNWKDDYRYLTELVLVLNRKSWYYAEKNEELSSLYVELYYEASDYALSTLKGEELKYYLNTTD